MLVALTLTLAACQPPDVNNVPDANLQIECLSNSDCASAGCSGQVCTTAEEAPGITTTCEYKEEYSCFKQTTCGCVEGVCAWGETEAYLSCLEELK